MPRLPCTAFRPLDRRAPFLVSPGRFRAATDARHYGLCGSQRGLDPRPGERVPCRNAMVRELPGVVRDRETGREEPGLIETFVPVLANGRCERSPLFRPLHLLTTERDRAVVGRWLQQRRPDLLRPWQRAG